MADEQTFESSLVPFIRYFSYEDIDDSAFEKIVLLLKDQFGLQIGLSTLPWAEAAYDYASADSRAGNATIVGVGDRTDVETAAFTNATFGHSFEYDDVHNPTNGHPGCVIVATAVAVGESVDATLEEVFTAIAAGYETYSRIGTLGGPDLQNRGWHAHALVGTFGAAATTAKLRGFDDHELHHALSIASSHSSGYLEYTSTGGSVKRVHSGISARGGIQAAKMAEHGITGPSKYLTGRKGFYSTYIGKDDVDWEQFEGRTELSLNRLWTKYYCTCGCIQPYLDAVYEIDSDPEDVSRITARLQPQSDVAVGTANENAFDPSNIVELQYSLPYQIAMAIEGVGNGYRTHRRIADGELAIEELNVGSTASKVELEVDERLDEEYAPKLVGEITVEYVDGGSDTAFVEDPRGAPDNPFTEEEMREKFDSLVSDVLGEDRAEELYRLIDSPHMDTPIDRITEHAF